ncbi:MAG: signal peptidase bacterial type [Clostridiaceae bacterium]|jgi:signal peptidase I|nr:signal peptidase bacterial type [Clostridiaceae bacterium]
MKNLKSFLIQLGCTFLLAFMISLIITIPKVEGTSMNPTLNESDVYNDRIIVEKLSTMRHDLKRGEVVIFKPYRNNNTLYIKRIIGLPNDIIEINNGFVYINGIKLNESYLQSNTLTEPKMEVHVPDDCIFVLGDNRSVSKDSRLLGSIPIENVVGHAVFKFNIRNLQFGNLDTYKTP